VKLIIKWSINGAPENDFFCDEVSKWIAEQIKAAIALKGELAYIIFNRNTSLKVFKIKGREEAIIETCSEVLVNYLRALVKEGEIKEAELWFIDEPDEFGPNEINMELGKNGKCAIWPHKLGYNMDVLMRLI
jgi:hypothetical protein